MVVRIGARTPALMYLARLGYLDEELRPFGERAEWDFLAAGSTDIGARIAADKIELGGSSPMPALTAQANGDPVVYVAATPPCPRFGALVCLPESGIAAAADLKGKRIALEQGWWHTSLLAEQLDSAGLTFARVTLVGGGKDFLSRLRLGEIDAAVAQGEEFIEAERNGDIRVLHGSHGVHSARSVWIAARRFATERRPQLLATVRAIARASRWATANQSAAAAMSRDYKGGDTALSLEVRARYPLGVEAIGPDFVAEQQAAARSLWRTGHFGHEVAVADGVIEGLAEEVQAAIADAAAALP